MSSSQENRKFYIRSPDLEFLQDGPIKIGNVITDMFFPQDPIATLQPISNTIQGAGYGTGRKSRENHASIDLSFSAKLYQAFGGQAEAKGSNAMHTLYDFDEIQSFYLKDNPTKADVKTLRDNDEEVKAALATGPIYIITGLKIAKGLRYSNERSSEAQASVRGGAQVNEHAVIQGKAEGTKGGTNTEKWPVLGSPIIAYRLHIIKSSKFLWRSEILASKSLDPKSHGFMSRDDEDEEDFDLESAEVGLEDVKYFAEEVDYEEVEEVGVEDMDEAYSMLYRGE